MSEGRWITLKGGRRVFIEEGKSITETIKHYDSKKGGKKIDKELKKPMSRREKVEKIQEGIRWEDSYTVDIVADKYGINPVEIQDLDSKSELAIKINDDIDKRSDKLAKKEAKEIKKIKKTKKYKVATEKNWDDLSHYEQSKYIDELKEHVTKYAEEKYGAKEIDNIKGWEGRQKLYDMEGLKFGISTYERSVTFQHPSHLDYPEELYEYRKENWKPTYTQRPTFAKRIYSGDVGNWLSFDEPYKSRKEIFKKGREEIDLILSNYHRVLNKKKTEKEKKGGKK